MQEEEKILAQLVRRFEYLEATSKVQRVRRIFVDVEKDNFRQVLDYLAKDMGFSMLLMITGLDEGDILAVIYHLSADNRIILNLRTRVSRDNPEIDTVTDLFPVADMYERELVDILGIKVNGLAEGPRYPLPDNWPKGEYPLRKDWNAGVKPEEAEAGDGCE
jgi:membrane-bound hydrogenase subunit beta